MSDNKWELGIRRARRDFAAGVRACAVPQGGGLQCAGCGRALSSLAHWFGPAGEILCALCWLGVREIRKPWQSG
jgi:hypothetical protein